MSEYELFQLFLLDQTLEKYSYKNIAPKGPVNVIGAAYYYADPNGPSMISGGKVHDALLKALRAGR